MLRDKKYPELFLKLRDTYPKYPPGRTKTHVAYKAYAAVTKEDSLTEADWEAIIQDIRERVAHQKEWTPESHYGPPGLQVFINQRRWLDDYEKRTVKTMDRYDRADLEIELRDPKTSEERKAKLRKIKDSGFKVVDAST